MTQVQTYAPRTAESLYGGPSASPAERAGAAPAAAAPAATELELDSQTMWPSECERLALINAVPGGQPSIGEQYLLEAFFMAKRSVPGPLAG